MRLIRANRKNDGFHSVDSIDFEMNFLSGKFFLKKIKGVDFFNHCCDLESNKGKSKISAQKIVFEFWNLNQLTCKK